MKRLVLTIAILIGLAAPAWAGFADALCRHEREAAGRWFIAKDMNCDGLLTISDVGLWAEWAFFLPGDGLLWAIMQSKPLATFLELTPAVYSGWFSGIVSAIIWLIAWLVLLAVLEGKIDS